MNSRLSLDDVGHFAALLVIGVLVLVATIDSVVPGRMNQSAPTLVATVESVLPSHLNQCVSSVPRSS